MSARTWALRALFAGLLAAMLLLSACGYWAVEEAPIQVGSAVVTPAPAPTSAVAP